MVLFSQTFLTVNETCNIVRAYVALSAINFFVIDSVLSRIICIMQHFFMLHVTRISHVLLKTDK